MLVNSNIEIKDSRSFRYIGSKFMNSEECNEEVLNRIQQARKATKTPKPTLE
jgi:hypothetical protein